MHKIVVAIDFSECSINAFLHSLSIADHCHGELILLWVQKSATEKDKYGEKILDSSIDVKAAFEDLIAKYQPEFPGVKLLWKIRKGKIYKEVTDEAKSVNAMLIVTGTHGASGFEEFWIGSNANKIIAASSCPVITIRGGINIQRPLKRIVFPIDSVEETRQKASFAGFLAKRHDAEIFILILYTSKSKALRDKVDVYTSQVVGYFNEEQIKHHVHHADCDNIALETIEYARKVDANLIAIMTQQEISTANIFLGSYAHQMVNNSPFPVLSVHPMSTASSGSSF